MKLLSIISILSVILFSSCRSRVDPNHYGVLMENFGKNGKKDYSLQRGRVSDWGRSRQLFQVPAWEQRAKFDSTMHMEASDKTAFTSTPSYSYLVKEDRAVDVVFNNAHLGSSGEFMQSLESNVLETRIYDITKDISRKYPTDTLMAVGGNMSFENEVKELVRRAFDTIGIKLITFTAPLVPTGGVQDRIDERNKVNSNLLVIDQKILEQKKKNELAALEKQYNDILTAGLSPEILQMKFLETWKEVKQPIYANPLTFFKAVQ